MCLPCVICLRSIPFRLSVPHHLRGALKIKTLPMARICRVYPPHLPMFSFHKFHANISPPPPPPRNFNSLIMSDKQHEHPPSYIDVLLLWCFFIKEIHAVVPYQHAVVPYQHAVVPYQHAVVPYQLAVAPQFLSLNPRQH